MPAGRPKKDIDPRQVELLASAFCTNEEIAAKLGCSSDTLTRNFAENLKNGRDTAKASLRVLQWQHAQKSVPMAIWLGKQHLGQAERIQQEITENRIIVERDSFESTTALPASGAAEDTEGETPI